MVESVLRKLPPSDLLVVTMAKLYDGFETRRSGVLNVLEAVQGACNSVLPGRPLKVFRLDGKLMDIETARSEPLAASSTSWLALATLAGPLLPRGLAVAADLGSTSSDIVPLRNGMPVPYLITGGLKIGNGRTDSGVPGSSAVAAELRRALLRVAERLGGPLDGAVISGEGELLLHQAILRIWPRCKIISLSDRVSPGASLSACAYALTRIAGDPARYPGNSGGSSGGSRRASTTVANGLTSTR
jgi:uncharacterized hydantoinase/oxoprolinase family protein